MIVKLLTEHHLELLSLKGGCRGFSESTLVKMSSSRGSSPRYKKFVDKRIMVIGLKLDSLFHCQVAEM